ncbi:protein phosphatase 2C domain-containing protein [Amycolatopsis endophytica]
MAERAGVGLDGHPRPSEDRVVVLDHAVAVLDGATSSDPTQPSGGWYAERLASRLAHELTGDGDLPAVLRRAIAGVANAEGLRPGLSPSSTVAIVRWTAERVDSLVLADSPIVAFGQTVDLLADDRLVILRRGGRLRTRQAVRSLRNHPDGFWVAEADPGAAAHALTSSRPRAGLDAVILATDGVSCGVDDYGLFTWTEALHLARAKGLNAVLDAVRAAEDSDPDARRWPRAKRHDDQAIVLVEFAGPGRP